jgi:hypothetical protein
VLTRVQLEIVLAQVKQSGISEQAWKTYLYQHYRVSDPAKLKQSAVDEVLAWLASQHGQDSRAF